MYAQDFSTIVQSRGVNADTLKLDLFIVNNEAAVLELGNGNLVLEFSTADWALISDGANAILIDTAGTVLNGSSDYFSDPNERYIPLNLTTITASQRLNVSFGQSEYTTQANGYQFAQNDTQRVATIAVIIAPAACDDEIDVNWSTAGSITTWATPPLFDDWEPVQTFASRVNDPNVSLAIIRSAHSLIGADSNLVNQDTLILYAEAAEAGETRVWFTPGLATFDDPSDPTTIVRNLGVGPPAGEPDTLIWRFTRPTGCQFDDTLFVTFQQFSAGPSDTICDAFSYNFQAVDTTGLVTATWTLFEAPAGGDVTYDDDSDFNGTVTLEPGSPAGLYRFEWLSDVEVDGDFLRDTLDLVFVFMEAGADTFSCEADTFDLAAVAPDAIIGTGGQWSSLATEITFDDDADPNTTVRTTAPGNYRLFWTLQDPVGGCTDIVDSVDVDFRYLEAGGDSTVCNGNSIEMYAEPTTLTGGGEWLIVNTPVGSTIDATAFTDVNDPNAEFTVDLAGTYRLYWQTQGTDGDCGIIRDSLDLTFNFIDAGADDIVCNADSVELNAQAASDIDGTGLWTVAPSSTGPGSVTFDEETDENTLVRVSQPGTYRLLWTVSGVSGCAAGVQDSVDVEFIYINAGDTVDACGTLTATMVAQDMNALYSVDGVWTLSTGPGAIENISDANSPTADIEVDTPGEYVFLWTSVADVNGCTVQDSVVVNYYVVSAGETDTVCDGGLTYVLDGQDFNADFGVGGEWTITAGPAGGSFDDDADPNATLTVTDPGLYTLQWATTGAVGTCPTLANTVDILFLPSAVAGVDIATCDGSVILAATPAAFGGMGMWAPITAGVTVDDAADPTSELTFSSPSGTLDSLEWVVTNGSCVSSDTIQVVSNRLQQYNVEGDTAVCEANAIPFLLTNSEAGVEYSLVDDSEPTTVFADTVSVGGPIEIEDISDIIPVGTTVLRVIADNGTCDTDMLNTITVTRNQSLKADVRFYLEGAVTAANTMATTANQVAQLDSIFGAGTDPSYIDGSGFMMPTDSTSSVTNLPANVVDLVKIELRTTDNGPTVDSAYVWLTTDGSVLNFDNATTNYAEFCAAGAGNYYIVMRHRNHLPAMSAVAEPIDDVVATYVYNTEGAFFNNAPGNTPGVIENSTTWCLIGGNVYDNDAFSDVGEINAADFFRVRVVAVNTPDEGYLVEDITQDGNVNAQDNTVVQENNWNLRITRMPNP